jgi:phosphate transport system permease protein
MKHSPHTSELVFFSLFRLSAIVAVAILFLVLILLYASGHSVLGWQFLTANWQQQDITKGGIFSAIIGSMYLGMGVMLIAFPLGVGTAIFLSEYRKDSLLQSAVQLAIRNLAGVPSVVYGLFGLAVFVHMLNMGMSLLAAVCTLSVMTLPWVITASVEALRTVPYKFRDSSLALGATQWQTISRVILPAALPGCITGGIIGIARALGETAPIILVGATFYLTKLPSSPFDKYMALPYHTFILATQHASPLAQKYAAGTAFILIVLTFLLSLAAIVLRSLYRRRHVW